MDRRILFVVLGVAALALAGLAFAAGGQGWNVAGIGPQDVDLAEIHDAFAIAELMYYEALGFCKKGEGGSFVQSGALRLDGALPCNTSGGQLSEAHVEGVLQLCEGARQLRSEYPAARQVKDAEIALVSGHGGNQICHASVILGRDWK